jgi:CubicO group peptidase (beta-lactamase class C family)
LSDVGTGGGGIRSTIGDMLRWQDAFLSGRIVSLESVQAMTLPPSRDGEPFGVTIGQQGGHTTYSTGGGGPGYRSTVKIFPDERIAVVVMTNSGAPQIGRTPEPEERPAPVEPAPGKKKKGKNPYRGGPQGPPSPARELEQFVTGLILERL